jgi:hypothetical protein
MAEKEQLDNTKSQKYGIYFYLKLINRKKLRADWIS